jgi:hypothetical protein
MYDAYRDSKSRLVLRRCQYRKFEDWLSCCPSSRRHCRSLMLCTVTRIRSQPNNITELKIRSFTSGSGPYEPLCHFSSGIIGDRPRTSLVGSVFTRPGQDFVESTGSHSQDTVFDSGLLLPFFDVLNPFIYTRRLITLV